MHISATLLFADYGSPTAVSSTISSNSNPFPLPLLVFVPQSASRSRRRVQAVEHSQNAIRQTNLLIQSLNSLHFNYPSAEYMSAKQISPFTLLQQRFLLRLYHQSQSHYYKCRSRSSSCGR